MKRIYINLQDPILTKEERVKELKRAATRRSNARKKPGYIPTPGDGLELRTVGRRTEFTIEELRKRHNDQSKQRQQRIRLETIAHYGGKCAFPECGDTNTNHLCMDHINGGGGVWRKAARGMHVYIWLRDHGYPEGYQVLCNNHNMEKSFYHTMTPNTYAKETYIK